MSYKNTTKQKINGIRNDEFDLTRLFKISNHCVFRSVINRCTVKVGLKLCQVYQDIIIEVIGSLSGLWKLIGLGGVRFRGAGSKKFHRTLYTRNVRWFVVNSFSHFLFDAIVTGLNSGPPVSRWTLLPLGHSTGVRLFLFVFWVDYGRFETSLIWLCHVSYTWTRT